MKTKTCILAILLAAGLSNSHAQDTWTQKADFGGAARYGAVGFSIGSKGYIGTGADSGFVFQKDFWEYDPATNAWTQKADFGGTERSSAVGFSIDSKGYIGTGTPFCITTKDFWEYDPATDAWTQKADLGGSERSSAVGFSTDSKGYIGTGQDCVSGGQRDFWEYDPVTNAWTQKVDFGGTGRFEAVGFSIGSKGYIGTGVDSPVNPTYFKDFWEYDPRPTPTPPQCDTGLIQNGGFETGDLTGWVIDGHTNDPVATNVEAHTGTFSALAGENPQAGDFCEELSEEPLGDSSFYQEFTVPAGTSTLSFWHWNCTFDSIAFDWQDAYITDTNGNILQTIFHQCLNGQIWILQTWDTTPYAGQTVRIKFLVHQDGFNPPGDVTGMYVDDVQVTVPCGSPTPTPTPSPSGCVFSQGYWKNHPEAWPVTELQLGNVTYTQDQLLSILHEAVRGNGLLILAHQEIAAKLNIANGADGSCIGQTLADADALIGDLVVPPVGDGYLAPRDVSALAEALDQYNEGMLCAPSCEGTPPPGPAPRVRPTAAPRPRP